jgi:hypothetical protein
MGSWRTQAGQTLVAGPQVEIGTNVTGNATGHRAGRYPDARATYQRSALLHKPFCEPGRKGDFCNRLEESARADSLRRESRPVRSLSFRDLRYRIQSVA